jgi:amino acid adenylation domain-containing protein
MRRDLVPPPDEPLEATATGRTASILHELIGQHPQQVAVRVGASVRTYAELDTAANRLAHHLRRRGASIDTVTAVRLPRGPDLPVAILAALKAGTAYLPLDPRHPVERHQRLLRDTGARLLLTAAEHRLDTNVGTVLVDDPRIQAEPVTRPQVRLWPDCLAYVLPTSGTTGGTKTVAMPHRSAANTLLYLGTDWGLAAGDMVLQLADISYSAAVRDMLGPLVNGATLELLPETGARAVEAVAERLTAGGVTCLLSCLPQTLSALLDLGAPAGNLRLLVLISEPLSARLVDRVRRSWGRQVRVIHQYGLTECAMTSLAADVPVDLAELDRVPVGRPIANTQAYLLDEDLRPVPPGTVAELYIGGAGLARGYHGQPAMTAERFVPDPFTPGARLYRTGDLARQRPDGTIECLGRTDRQIKIRGYRIEPAEIEAALQAHPAVRRAAVGPYPEPSGALRLVAWVVAHDSAGDGLTGDELRRYLSSRLPGFLVPSVITLVDEMPLNLNGKIDWAALPAPQPGASNVAGLNRTDPRELPDRHAAPASLTVAEQAIARLWRELLGVDALDADSHFFQLGAHSLTASRLVARVNRTFGTDLPISSVFTAPRLGDFARRVQDAVLRDIIDRRGSGRGNA